MTKENNSLLVRDFGRLENDFWDASWHLFAGRPVLTYDIYTFNFYKKKKKKTREKKCDVNTRYPRRARWDFRVVLDDYFYIWTLTWLNIWRIEERMKYCEWNWGGGFIVTIIFIYGSFLGLRCLCLQLWNCAVLNVGSDDTYFYW